MTRRPLFWIAFGVLGIAGAFTAVRLFRVALPNVSLEVTMDREAAIAGAEEIADRLGWAPPDARSAASFGQVDPEVQTYVELEGGGPEAFQEVVDRGAYHPYQWRVRRFAEGAIEEAEVRFSPVGEPFGFRLRLREDDAGGGNLDRVAALALAEREAAAWPVDLGPFRLIESSAETRPGGRVDQAFVYERDDITRAEARFRLRLVVAGDHLSELTHFVFVPEAFARRYAEMRSTNDAIALVSQSFFILVYVLLGAGVGTALLLRLRWVEWRTAMLWGSVIALLFGLNSINALPLAWMGYDTAVSARTFVFQNMAAVAAMAVLGAPILGFFLLAGESLGRRAFPMHVQQWRFWNPEVAASKRALGITVAAYLLVGIQVGYVVLFYLGTSRLEGWWSPADALVQPDLLATYQPWLQAVSVSLFASFWEESVFRAVPIACAALIGARYGRRNLWIWGAVLLQAVVFAAGHANYPQQPAYARVVELTPPALAWGAIYVFYGLVPTILAHFLYDLALISSVLFTSHAPVDQGVVLLIAAIPLAVVLRARTRGRAVDEVPQWSLNRSWTPAPSSVESSPPEDPGPAEPPPLPPPRSGTLPSVPSWTVPAGASVGLALWIAALVTAVPSPRLQSTRSEAIGAARAEMERRGFDVSGRTVLVRAGGARGAGHEYVFEEAGPEAFDSLEGTFLAPPQWVVRFVDWEAEPADRVEEFIVNVAADGSLRRVAHILPESRAGPSLAQDSARVLARTALPPGAWEEVGAEEAARDARTDWEFTFRDRSVLVGLAGEGRASVSVLGDELTDVRQFVDVPEEWERDRREAESRTSMIGLGLVFVLVLMFGASAIVAIVVWSRGGLETSFVWKVGGVTLVAMVAAMANSWPDTAARFSTLEPYVLQAAGVGIGLVLLSIVSAATLGLASALGFSWSTGVATLRAPRGFGIAVGCLLAGLSAAAFRLAGGLPASPDYSGAAAFAPSLALPLNGVLPFLFLASAMTVLAVSHRRFAARRVLRGTTTFAILALGLVLVPDALRSSILLWMAAGLGGTAVVSSLVYLLGALPILAPAIFGTVVVLGSLGSIVHPAYTGAAVGEVLVALIIGVLAWIWTRTWSEESHAPDH